ncbi:pyocin knob domain-containing protein [Sinorhizobium meliloti]|uniref:pyocin knob domain-containing protein n=1 Tax=Rhizobium meliloti TaxID=382 RepID=UPI0002E4E00F|nr:pyocin knob domain-containing protein [Sinorhizobium meliloti]MDX0298294.1 phage tail protein [Sinorhizobium meliloti]MDX0310570.1 phage tail protein [Sinorhizobium meliloti]RVG15053.1 phage tail protein [Sinorhizobium meliloti]RVG54050.1 phage tail protein [Sinorhizobium meliloti]RVK96125.1 phage tail protein [Sinorhizobium meliloti]
MTIPYVTGTVSVTAGSAVVTGSGTAWAAALIAGGIFGLDSSNGNPVPILSVDSNTQLTLAKPWRGTTAAGQGYWIVRDTAYLQQQTVNAQALSTYIQRLDNAVLSALAGLTPAADKLAYFTGANSGALADIKAKGRDLLSSTGVLDALLKLGPVWGGSVRSPANSDVGLVDGDLNTITVAGVYTLSGNWANTYAGAGSAATTGTLVVLQRSTNAVFQYFYRDNNQVFRRNTVNGGTSWTDWTIVELPVVGTVSNSAGFPAGAVIERGSNANGEYVKFADGTMICTSPEITVSMNQATGNLFYSNAVSAAMPVLFTGIQPVGFGHIHTTINGWVNARTAFGSWVGAAYSASSRASDTIRFGAIGRWF